MNDLIEEAEKWLAVEQTGYPVPNGRDLICALVERLKELKKKRTKGEINEAYAKTIEANKDEISKLKMKVNRLEQKLDSKTERLKIQSEVIKFATENGSYYPEAFDHIENLLSKLNKE